jgi:hypothetical protein
MEGKTWDIYGGTPPVPCCTVTNGGGGTSGDTILYSLLDTIINEITDGVNQTIITGTTVGSIPSGVYNYKIYNLGVDPSDPMSAVNPMIINGIPVVSKVFEFGTNSNKPITNTTSYDPNGNTLLIVYTT